MWSALTQKDPRLWSSSTKGCEKLSSKRVANLATIRGRAVSACQAQRSDGFKMSGTSRMTMQQNTNIVKYVRTAAYSNHTLLYQNGLIWVELAGEAAVLQLTSSSVCSWASLSCDRKHEAAGSGLLQDHGRSVTVHRGDRLPFAPDKHRRCLVDSATPPH